MPIKSYDFIFYLYIFQTSLILLLPSLLDFSISYYFKFIISVFIFGILTFETIFFKAIEDKIEITNNAAMAT